jgi:hypothetical protein
MCLTLIGLFLWAGVAGMCQSVAPAPATSARVDESHQGTIQWTKCKDTAPEFSVSNLAPKERRFEAQAWHWDAAQVDSKSALHSPFSTSAAQSCMVDRGLLHSFQAKLEPLPAQLPNAKFGPIPTQWPGAKFEPIPTDWPNLKIIPLASRPAAPAIKSIPVK